MSYLVVQAPSHVDKIKDNIYEWKLNNISTYIINIIYNNSYITFDFSYNSIYFYHLNIKYNGIKWQLELDIKLNEGLDTTNYCYIVFVDIIKKINAEIEENEYPDKILTLIEKYIEDAEFDENNEEDIDVKDIDVKDIDNDEEQDVDEEQDIDEEQDVDEDEYEYCVEKNEYFEN
jgi:hypothetical protein